MSDDIKTGPKDFLPPKEKKEHGNKQYDIPSLIPEILNRMEQGESLTQICKLDYMPSVALIMKHLSFDKEFSEQYTRARELGLERHSDDIFQIADNCPNDANAINKARLQIDARKWVLSKLLPKKYGDKQALDVTGKLTLGEIVEQAFKLKADKAQEAKETQS